MKKILLFAAVIIVYISMLIGLVLSIIDAEFIPRSDLVLMSSFILAWATFMTWFVIGIYHKIFDQ